MTDELLTSEMTTDQMRAWLLEYAWMDDKDAQRRMVDCIMAQADVVDLVTTRADMYAGAQFEPGPEAFSEGMGHALSELYECHDAPHLQTCPLWRADPDARYKVASFPGVAFRVVGHAEKWNEKYETMDVDPDWVDAVMIGDDHKHRIEASELTLIDEHEYCGGCGQMGCTADGRPAE